jgi:hypothetical protein
VTRLREAVSESERSSQLLVDSIPGLVAAHHDFRSAGGSRSTVASARWGLSVVPFRTNPLRDEKGNIAKWYGINTDIEDRKRAEDALDERASVSPAGRDDPGTGLVRSRSCLPDCHTETLLGDPRFLQAHLTIRRRLVVSEAAEQRENGLCLAGLAQVGDAS